MGNAMEVAWRAGWRADDENRIPTGELHAQRRQARSDQTIISTRHSMLPAVACGVVLLAIALTDPLHAQQATPPTSYGGPLLDRSTLTGDWGGARDALAAQGITIAPSLTQFYQGPTAVNTDGIFEYGG